jgi:phospholipid/cholesterol/gamma-HCH transport system substrate-binding protein
VISRRILLNLATFVLLFLLLCFWAVRNVISIDLIERPYSVTAEFETSPGLRPGFEVTYLGVRVGDIQGVDLVGDRVVVDLDIERGTDLPVDMTAAVRRKSAVGEPYVDLSPPEGYDGGGPFIDPGYVVPLERTSTPLSYAELFVSLDALVDAIPPDDLDTLVHELAVSLEGRGPAIRTLLESASDLTGTLASRADLLDSLATELTRLTHTVADHRDAIGSTFDNVAALAETLAANSQDVNAVLADGPGFLGRVADLLDVSVTDLGCTVDALAPIAGSLSEPERLAQLVRLLRTAEPAANAILDARVETGELGADGPYLNGAFEFNLGGVPVPIYDTAPTLPSAPALDECAPAAPAGGVGEGDQAAGATPAIPAEPGERPDISDRPAAPSPAVPESTDREADPGFDLTDLVRPFALVLAMGLLVALVAIRPWRILGASRGGDHTEEP